MEHLHQYDSNGVQLCCSTERHIHQKAEEHLHSHNHSHSHDTTKSSIFSLFKWPLISFISLSFCLLFDRFFHVSWMTKNVQIIAYALSYLPVGLPVIIETIENIKKGYIFSEFFLMTIATLGAFAIGEYPEAVAVMLFYAIGEVFQTLAVSRAKSDIQNLIDQRPDTVTILLHDNTKEMPAKKVPIGSIIQLKAGEKVALDGVLMSEKGVFSTSSLTGESIPDVKQANDTLLAGMINLDTVTQMRTTSAYEDSKLSKMLSLIQEASKHKAPTELFLRKFARWYTPIVVFAAIAICFLPYFFIANYHFYDWLYRSLIFLVISCPCALVVAKELSIDTALGDLFPEDKVAHVKALKEKGKIIAFVGDGINDALLLR